MRRYASVFCIVAVASLAVHCGSESNGATDSGLNNNQSTQRDARTLPDVYVPQPENCSAQDLPAQIECGLGRRCTVVSGGLYDGTGQFKCTDDGTIGPLNDCTQTLPSGPDQCQAGTVCADPLGGGEPRCVHFCQEPFGFCPSGVCGKPIQLSGASLYLCIPSNDCDALTAQTTCNATGVSCYWSVRAPDVTLCMTSGSTVQGGSCQLDETCYPTGCDFNECGSGLTCFGPPGNTTCQPVCAAGSGPAGCAGASECLDVGHDTYGVCSDLSPP